MRRLVTLAVLATAVGMGVPAYAHPYDCAGRLPDEVGYDAGLVCRYCQDPYGQDAAPHHCEDGYTGWTWVYCSLQLPGECLVPAPVHG